jgi:RNA polymerase sigma-70 factor (ECF subfamily)
VDELVAAFEARLPSDVRVSADDRSSLGAELVELVARARDEVPEVALDAAAFCGYLAERVALDARGAPSLQSVRAGDLWIAFGCVSGDGSAIAAFEVRFAPNIRQALARAFDQDIAEEAELRLRNRLFLTEGEDRARLASYAGRGALAGWLRAAAATTAIDLLRARREVPSDPEAIARHGDAIDPLLAALKQRYRDEFRAAFTAASEELAPRDRTILRYRFVDDLSIDEIGKLYRVHRATVARWIATIRETLFEGTRAQLQRRLEIPREDLDSVLRMIESQMEISIEAALRP